MILSVDTDICNLALTDLGTYPTVMDIDNPTTKEERVFAQYYDLCRRLLLKKFQPNFAVARALTTLVVGTPAFGYGYYYALPSDCLQLLGIGNLECRANDYSVEQGPQGQRCIATNQQYDDGCPVRYVVDVTNVADMTENFQRLFGGELAEITCLPITQDIQKLGAIRTINQGRRIAYSSLEAMENRPIRKSRSRMRESRWLYDPDYTGKR